MSLGENVSAKKSSIPMRQDEHHINDKTQRMVGGEDGGVREWMSSNNRYTH